jgi:hypothetical protein
LGIARTMGSGWGRSHSIWRWTALLIAVPMYFQILSIVRIPPYVRHDLTIVICAALAAFLCVSYVVYRSANTRPARWYILANAIGAAAEVALFYMGYYFFVILISRVVHDLSAFAFYISHDVNRNAGTTRNIIYRSLRFLKIPIIALCPMIAMAMAFPITYFMQHDVFYRVAVPLAFLHYYTDAFAWKKGSLHREHIHMR